MDHSGCVVFVMFFCGGNHGNRLWHCSWMDLDCETCEKTIILDVRSIDLCHSQEGGCLSERALLTSISKVFLENVVQLWLQVGMAEQSI